VIGFTFAYLIAAAAITGLNTAYSAAVLRSWRRAGFIGALLAALYAVLFVLLNLEAYSLLDRLSDALRRPRRSDVPHPKRRLGRLGGGGEGEPAPADLKARSLSESLMLRRD
jgi:hypothetical protein